MEFDYKGKTYDTDSSSRIFTTTSEYNDFMAGFKEWEARH